MPYKAIGPFLHLILPHQDPASCSNHAPTLYISSPSFFDTSLQDKKPNTRLYHQSSNASPQYAPNPPHLHPRRPHGRPPRVYRHGQSRQDYLQRLSEPPRSMRQGRSEEHTSELQSHVNLVCRLLLEKKK